MLDKPRPRSSTLRGELESVRGRKEGRKGEKGGVKVEILAGGLVATDDPNKGDREAAALTPLGKEGVSESQEKRPTYRPCSVPTVCGHENKLG